MKVNQKQNKNQVVASTVEMQRYSSTFVISGVVVVSLVATYECRKIIIYKRGLMKKSILKRDEER